MAYRDADHDLDDEVALDGHRQPQVEALAGRLLEARGGGELVVLLRGERRVRTCVSRFKGRRSCASKAVVVSAAASSAEATAGVLVAMPRTAIWPLYLPACLRT